MLHFAKEFNTTQQILGYIKLKGKPTPTLDLFRSNGEYLTAEKTSHYEKSHVLQDGKLASSLDNSSTDIVVNPELAHFVSEGHLLSIEDEYVSVKSVDTTTNTITVKSRGYGSTPVSTHTADTPVYVISKVEAEGVVTEDYKKTISKEIVNYLQENTKSVILTQRAINISHKDVNQLEAEETAAKLNEEGQELNRSVLYSKGNFDTEGGRHSIRGLKDLIITYGGSVYDAQKNLTDDKLDLFITSLLQKGSTVNAFILNPLALNKVFKRMQNTLFIDKKDQGKMIAGGVIEGYMPSSMGGKIIRFVVDTDCRPTDIFIVDKDGLFFIPMKDKKTGKKIVLQAQDEKNVSSAVVNKTIRTIGTTKVEKVSTFGYITNIF